MVRDLGMDLHSWFDNLNGRGQVLSPQVIQGVSLQALILNKIKVINIETNTRKKVGRFQMC